MDAKKLQELYETVGRDTGRTYPAESRDEMNYAIDYTEARFHGKSHGEAIESAEAMAIKFNKPAKPQPKVKMPTFCPYVGGWESQ